MEIFNKLFIFIADVNLGAYYPLYLTGSLCGIYFIGVWVAVFYKPTRNVDKIKLLSAVLALYLLCAVKIACDCFFGLPLDGGVLTASLLFAFFTQIEFCLFCSFKNRKPQKVACNNQLIGADLTENRQLEHLLKDDGLASNPFKRATILPTNKLQEVDETKIETNYSYLLKWIDDLLNYPLDETDRDFLQEVKFDVKKYSLQNPSNFERLRFSTNLDRIIKIASKYENAIFDAV